MRALIKLLNLLIGEKRTEEAIEVGRRMLTLNPNDNHGVRDIVLGQLLLARDVGGAEELLKRCENDGSAVFCRRAFDQNENAVQKTSVLQVEKFSQVNFHALDNFLPIYDFFTLNNHPSSIPEAEFDGLRFGISNPNLLGAAFEVFVPLENDFGGTVAWGKKLDHELGYKFHPRRPSLANSATEKRRIGTKHDFRLALQSEAGIIGHRMQVGPLRAELAEHVVEIDRDFYMFPSRGGHDDQLSLDQLRVLILHAGFEKILGA